MKCFELRRTFREKEIVARILLPDQGIHVSLYGGDLSHIGAVGIVDPSGNCSVTQFPGHKEGAICRRWAESLSDAGFCPSVVEAGIHYDNLDQVGIEAVVAITENLLRESLTRLRLENQELNLK